jgi:hypothetical protein
MYVIMQMEAKTMKKRLYWIFTLSLVVLFSTSSLVWAKSDAKDAGTWAPADKEYYLTESELAFIRPGLELEILDVVIPSDGLTEVEFKITDPAGLPLDREGISTPGPVSTNFILSVIPAGEEAYVAYTTRVQTSPITGDSATQATSDSGGTYTDMGDGVYLYKFGTEVPEGYDMDATHTLGIYARRDLRDFDLDRYVTNELEHFIPSGSGTPDPRDIVTTETCNRCHDPLAIHGGSRQEVGLCILCHNPTQSIDPDTGDSVNMPYMVHKIHYGQNLVNGYTIIGYRQSVHDYSHVVFPPSPSPGDPYDCEVCHTGGTPTDEFPMVATPAAGTVCDGSGLSMTEIEWGDEGNIEIRLNSETGTLFAASGTAGSAMTGKWVTDGKPFFLLDAGSGEAIQELGVDNSVLGCAENPPGTFRGTAAVDHTNWMTRPSRVVCGSCHDDINFETGEGHLAQSNDDNCSFCHVPDSGNEYDASVNGAHQVFYRSAQLDGFYVEILSIVDTGPGQSPLVTFSMYDKFGPIMPAEINRMRFSIQGPNEDFSYRVEETATNGLVQDGDNWTYRFAAKLPMDAMGSYTLGVEGRLDAAIDVGEDEPFEDEDQMETFSVPFAVTGDSVMARRQIVDDYKCENCHSRLSLHGDNRQNATDYCQTCHQPGATDAAVRPEGTGEPQSIDFRYMVHKIHAGAELETGYTVYGYRSSFHDFSEVHYVGELSNCEGCHVDDSYMLPLPATNIAVTTPRDFWTPMLPETASCLSCHDSSAAAAHADSNTGDFGEACSVCHGEGATYAVERVHPGLGE